jgi:hypothetical protein
MTCLPGYEQYQNSMGQSSYFSDPDKAVLQHLYPGGTVDPTVLFLASSDTEVEAGDTVTVNGVVKNIGDWGAAGMYARFYFSDDDEITISSDTFLGFVNIDYLYSGGFTYPVKDVTIPSGTPDGVYYLGLLLTGGDDVDETNNVGVIEIQVGDVIDPCDGDTNSDGLVNVVDLLAIISAWGPCSGDCSEDFDESGHVDVTDLLLVIAQWGNCV